MKTFILILWILTPNGEKYGLESIWYGLEDCEHAGEFMAKSLGTGVTYECKAE